MPTVSWYCFPDTVDPSPYCKLNDFPSALEVDEADGVYLVWPLQVEPQVDAGRNKSDEPVSKSTMNCLDFKKKKLVRVAMWGI
jgi:hypothetical protein